MWNCIATDIVSPVSLAQPDFPPVMRQHTSGSFLRLFAFMRMGSKGSYEGIEDLHVMSHIIPSYTLMERNVGKNYIIKFLISL